MITASTLSSIDTWTMSSNTSVEFLVTSASGKQTGYLQSINSDVNTLPNATYGVQKGIADPSGQKPPLPDINYFNVNSPNNGIYYLWVIGKQSGRYHLDIVFGSGTDLALKSKETSIDGTLITNQVDKYTVTIPDGTIQKVNN